MTDQLEEVEFRPCITPVWIVKFFRDLTSATPNRIAYMSYGSEEEVAQRALVGMDQGEACRVEICRVVLKPPIVAFGEYRYL